MSERLQELLEKKEIDSYDLDFLFELIDDKGHHVVLLMDEFEHLARNQNIGPEVHYGLRSLAIHHNLAYLTASRRDLVDLSPSDDIRSSPLFNIFANVWLPLFATDIARELLEGSLAATSTRFTDSEVQYLTLLSGCHPFFLQMASALLYDACQQNLPEQERAALLAAQLREQAAPHLEHLWKISEDPERIVLTILAIWEDSAHAGDHEPTTANLTRLYTRAQAILAGLFRRALLSSYNGSLRLFSPVFGEWIRSELLSQAGETENFDQWLADKRGLIERIPEATRHHASEVLERVPSRYRSMVSSWLIDSSTSVEVIDLIRSIQST